MTNSFPAAPAEDISGAALVVRETADLIASRGISRDEIALAVHQDDAGRRRHAYYALYGDYYEGKQRDPRSLRFTTADLDQERTFTARHNVCQAIVDVLVERLLVVSFTATTRSAQRKTQAAEKATKQLWRWWQWNRMDVVARTTHHRTLSLGDAFVIVEYDQDAGYPRFFLQKPAEITAVYDEYDQLVTVYKAWEQGEAGGGTASTRRVLRINKYQRGIIEKFVGPVGGFGAFDYYTGDGDAGTTLLLDANFELLPLPVVHFRNAPRGDTFGRSDLADAVPMQDTFNMRTWATSQAAMFQGAKIYYGVNIEPLTDADTGEQRQPPYGPNVFWYLFARDPEKAAQLGALEAGDLAQLQEVADRELKTIAGLLGIPVHLIWPEGGLPSGESLKTAEARLVAKLRDRAATMGNGWEDAMQLAIRYANAYGDAGLPADLMLVTDWEPFGTRTDLSDEQTLQLRADDLSWRQRMRERNYDEEEIDRIEQERAEAAALLPAAPAPASDETADADAAEGRADASQAPVDADGDEGA
jgi:hypothetical protein